MACCRICCGCQTCAEGQEGKCCCGGESGSCCQPGEHCCSGVCVPDGCGADCKHLACISLEWDLEYLDADQWIPSVGKATIACAGASQQLVTISLASCFGSGATATVTGPAGYRRADMGPLSGVSLTNAGSGYAKLGRVAPTLTVSGGTGTGLTVTPTVTATNDACGIPTWSVTAVKFSGGTGYANGESLTVTTKAGDTTKAAAVMTVQTEPRSQPTLTAAVTGGATLTVATSANAGTPQTWGVSGVTVSGTTSGYADNDPVTFSYGANITEQQAAKAHIVTARTTPTVTASVSSGSGASLGVTLNASPATPPDTALWQVKSVSVTKGGSGYADGESVVFTVTDGVEVSTAAAVITASRENPNLTPYVWGDDGTTAGSGAIVTATMNETTDWDGKPAWEVSALSIVNGGSGYEVGEYFWYEELDPGIGNDPPYYVLQIDGWWITSVDGNGAITGIGLDPNGGTNGLFYKAGPVQSVAVQSGGGYYKATDAISRVIVTTPGKYYYYTGVPTGVTVQSAGEYYREDATKAPYVADVTVTINQAMPSQGTGAKISATVDSDTNSQTFGQVGVTLENAGDNYLARREPDPRGSRVTWLENNGAKSGNFPLSELGLLGSGPTAHEVWFGMGADPCCSVDWVGYHNFGPWWPSSLLSNCQTSGNVQECQPSVSITDYEGNQIEVLRGTTKLTRSPVWFAEDCFDPCGECESPCYELGPVTFGGWFIEQTKADLEALAAAAGWSITFSYPPMLNGYCPGVPPDPVTGNRLCPGPYTDECGQTLTSAVATPPDQVSCGDCGTEWVAFARLCYCSGCNGIPGDYWPSFWWNPGGSTPCSSLVPCYDTFPDLRLPRLCLGNPFP